MHDAPDDSLPLQPSAPRPVRRRNRKFSLPDHHHEEAAGERIEAFLDGPPTRRRRSRPHRRRPLDLETRIDWTAALQREAARQARYGRPTAVLVIDLIVGPGPGDPDRSARQLVEVLGREARETDRAVRTSQRRFMILLPETTQDDAAHLGNRIERGYRSLAEETRIPAQLRIEIAVLRRGADPDDAIADADRRLASAS
jgi:diguanylate cyclase with GGDEF domain